MRLLLAEDDQRLGKLVVYMLQQEAHQVEWAVTGDEALEMALYQSFDVILLDWMMPGLSGVEVCQRLRQKGYQQPILLLTAKDAISDKVEGLDAGADDYLVKPFEFSELFARLRALGRRSATPLQEDVIEVGNLSINRTAHAVSRSGREIQLTKREFQLLDLLVQNRGHVLPRSLILDRIWGLDSEVTDNNLDAYVRLLRRKIGGAGEVEIIRNIRGVGYTIALE